MCAVDLNKVKTRLDSSLRGRSKSLDSLPDLVRRHLLDPGERVREGQVARRPHVVRPPAEVLGRNVPLPRLASVPGRNSAGLAPSVGQLTADLVALRVHEVGDALQGRYLAVLPEAGVLGADSAVGKHRGCFDYGQGGPAHGEGAEVDEVLSQLLVKGFLLQTTQGGQQWICKLKYQPNL